MSPNHRYLVLHQLPFEEPHMHPQPLGRSARHEWLGCGSPALVDGGWFPGLEHEQKVEALDAREKWACDFCQLLKHQNSEVPGFYLWMEHSNIIDTNLTYNGYNVCCNQLHCLLITQLHIPESTRVAKQYSYLTWNQQFQLCNWGRATATELVCFKMLLNPLKSLASKAFWAASFWCKTCFKMCSWTNMSTTYQGKIINQLEAICFPCGSQKVPASSALKFIPKSPSTWRNFSAILKRCESSPRSFLMYRLAEDFGWQNMTVWMSCY